MLKSKIIEAPKCAIPKAYKKFDIIKCIFLILIFIDGSTGEVMIEKGFY